MSMLDFQKEENDVFHPLALHMISIFNCKG